MRALIIATFVGVAQLSYAQDVQMAFASLSTNDKIAIAKSSIEVPAWHEKSFWPVYEQYVHQAEQAESKLHRSLSDLTAVDATYSADEALQSAQNFLSASRDALELQKRYYKQIGDALNGVIAFQFLQTEMVFDMMECSKIYDGSKWRQYRFQPTSASADNFKRAKYNAIEKALKLTDANKHLFWQVYLQFEEEVDNVLGEEYSVMSLYAGEPSDYTPALAKRLGSDLLALRERELKLKEKYFARMRDSVSPDVAARFLAWEDYYSTVSKMHGWAEMQ